MFNDILIEYRQKVDVYSELAKAVASILDELLKKAGISVHFLSWRVKDEATLRQKLEARHKKYGQLDDVTDVAGIRIVTFFADQVDEVAELIDHEFRVDYENSVDKSRVLDPNQFGYLSRHYVVELSRERLSQGDFSRFSGYKCEVQIRSILQHAWAEIEHDLGYKNRESVPREIRRSFSRLAGLLELADSEFGRIRDELSQFARTVTARLEKGLDFVQIDKPSLLEFIRTTPIVARVDELIRTALGAESIVDRDWLELWIPIMYRAGFETLGDLKKAIERHEAVLPEFARELRKALGREGESVPIARGYSVVRAVDATLASSGLEVLRSAYNVDTRPIGDDYLKRLCEAWSKAAESRGST